MNKWWEGYPLRMIQTNFREIDMEDINAKSYVNDLKEFGATAVLLNAAGIIASYDTEIKEQPRSLYLHGDDLGTIIEECHSQDIKVFARTDFSKVRYDVYEKHPEWAYRTLEGDIVNCNGYVSVCPNSEYQQKIKLDILDECLRMFSFDGVFFNMSGFMVVEYNGTYHGTCQCENCKTKFWEMYQEELPKADEPRNPVYKKYMAFKARVTAEHKAKMIEVIRNVSPQIAINDVDYIRSESNTDIGVDKWVYSASMNARKSSGSLRLRPADNASVDFMGFRYRNISVSPGQMALRQWQNLANAGSCSLFIMGRLDNHRDTSALEVTKEVFQFHKKYEKLFTSLVSDAKVLLIHKGLLARNDPEVYGWIRALSESHVPFDEMNLKELTSVEHLSGKHVIILADTKFISSEQAKILDEFSQNGGTVIATGDTAMYTPSFAPLEKPTLNCLGVKKVKEKRKNLKSTIYEVVESEKQSFPHCTSTPFIAPSEEVMLVEPEENTDTYLRLIPEHPYGPPEICYYTEVTSEPGIFVHHYGKGKGIYVPWMVGAFYFKEGYQNSLNIMQDILFSLAGVDEMAPDLTPMVEMNICKNDTCKLIQFVNTTGCFANSFFTPVPVYRIKVMLPGLMPESKVSTLRGGKASIENENGTYYIALDVVNDYEGIVIE